ncbi:GNAT family N-acetyltransferase [Spirosoma sp.]|uniref:GNAT family N-acetyltransferase n=1 Tax=Spirosoma sp. TaxID=1899569 RepID=UPI002637F860|nr:GNAT family N-acetyltransferase [Spirosoma sp.]MCX6215120.1 GNAT family N-acetyltransferase [Spirosoma sp.]
MITITPATEHDLPIIRAIAYQTWPSTFGEILSADQIGYMLDMMYSMDALNRQVNEQNHVFLLAQESESKTYLGFTSYEFDYKGLSKTKIHKIYLLPASQGKGVGKLLINEVAELSSAHGNDTLSLNVNKYNKAVQFYERMDFFIVDNETIDIGNGFIMDDYVMEKPMKM